MASIADCVRLSTKRTAVWRRCRRCDALAPLAPDQTHCKNCTPPPSKPFRRPLAA